MNMISRFVVYQYSKPITKGGVGERIGFFEDYEPARNLARRHAKELSMLGEDFYSISVWDNASQIWRFEVLNPEHK